jgi:hypothetical protein
MQTITVNKQTLQYLLDSVSDQESYDYAECESMGWSEVELERHTYNLILELQSVINAN